MIELYESGWSTTDIARMLERPVSTVSCILTQEGIERRPENRKVELRIPMEECHEAARLYWEEEMTLQEVADEMGFESMDSAKRRIVRAGSNVRDNGEATKLSFKRGTRSAEEYAKRISRWHKEGRFPQSRPSGSRKTRP